VQRAEVDGFGGVALVGHGHGFACAFVADAYVAKELFGLCPRAVDFLLSEPEAALLLRLVILAVVVSSQCL
jgi:hypothetical protein